jgi:NTE family protein
VYKASVTAREPVLGLALGGGSARGWAHIGIIRALMEVGIEPSIVTGCSIGSIVGASYVAGNLQRLEDWVRSLSRLDVAGFYDLRLSLNGFVDADKLKEFLVHNVCAEDQLIDDLEKVYASVSTDLDTGKEVWFSKGPVLDSVLASIALPGLFAPVHNQGRWLVDGGLVNPVPVSLCHALGADIVIGVNLNGDVVGKHRKPLPEGKTAEGNGTLDRLLGSIKSYSNNWFSSEQSALDPPSLFDSIAGSINITQDRITRSRMAGDPPDVLLNPQLAHIGLLEFNRASEAIAEGRDCVNRMMSEIEHVLRRR